MGIGYHLCRQRRRKEQRPLNESGSQVACALDIKDVAAICSWVPNQAELSKISGDVGDGLTPTILSIWLDLAESTVLIRTPEGRALGFCTLSRHECESLPLDALEICHAITDPASARPWAYLRLLQSAAEAAGSLGARRVIGRVSLRNRRLAAFLLIHGAVEFTTSPSWAASGFHWFWEWAGACQVQRIRLTG